MKLIRVSLSELVPPAHPVRAVWDESKLNELADSIKRVGLVVPMGVKKIETGYEVVHGHRRLLACRSAGIVVVPCILMAENDGSDEAWKIAENFGREDLSPAEEAAYFAELMERLGNDTDQVVKATGHRREYVEGRLNLLQGDAKVLNALVQKQISLGVAQQLNKVVREGDRRYLLEFARRDGCTVATAAAWVQTYNARLEGVRFPPPATEAQPGVSVPPPNPMKCFVCNSSEEPWDLHILYIHGACQRMMERQGAARALEAAKAAPE